MLLTLNIIHNGNLVILGIYWSTEKGHCTVQVWDCVWSDTDVQGVHFRMLKTRDLQGFRGGGNCSKKWKKVKIT